MDDYPSALWPEGAQLALMRAALLDGPAAVAAFHEWRDAIIFDDLDPGSFRLLPLLRWNLNRLGVKDPLIARLDSVSRFLLVETTMKLDLLRRLALALHGMDVPRLLLKGAAIGRRYYPHPSLRPMADCDLLIPDGRHLFTMERLFAAGWRTNGGEDAVRHYSADLWHQPFPTIFVELHWRSGIESTLRDDRMMWDASEELVFNNVPCRAFCPGDEIIHACRHGFNWTPEAPPMRWLADCAMIVRQSGAQIDWTRLAERARAMEQTLCVRHSLEWIHREGCAPVPAEALQKLQAQRPRRRERRIYGLKAQPRDWGVSARLYAGFFSRELPRWRWPLHPRRVLRYFAGQFDLDDHADILRYFVYHLRQQAQLHRKSHQESLYTKAALALGMRWISSTWLHADFTGALEEPSKLCWARRKIKLSGFACAHDGTHTGPMRIVHRGRAVDSVRTEQLRVDIAAHMPQFPNAINSGFSLLFDLPAGECELVIERRGTGDWEPLFWVKIGGLQILDGTPMPTLFPIAPSRIEFGQAASEQFLPSGWGAREGTFRWSDGASATMIFGLAKIENMHLDIALSPFLTTQLDAQSIILSLNRHKLGAWDLGKETNKLSLLLPKALLKHNNTLVFALPRAISPAAAGMNADERKLAIRVEWVNLRPDKTGERPEFSIQSLDFPAGLQKKGDSNAEFVTPSNSSNMGAIHFSIDTGMVSALQAVLPLETFVETGTFQGESVSAVRPLFKSIFTVELFPELHAAAAAKFQGDAAIEVLQGNSPAALENLRPRLQNESVLYWLDAHWCASSEKNVTAGENSPCPLLQELDAIRALNEKSVVLIDDARLFLSTPPPPHDAGNWPDFDTVVRKLFTLGPTHRLAVINDVIAFVPAGALPGLRRYARDHSPNMLVELAKAKLYGPLKQDRDELAANVNQLTAALKQSEDDRAARLQVLERLDQQLAASETDRAARLEAITKLDKLLKETSDRLAISEADRAARLDVIERQDLLLKEQAALLETLRNHPV